MDILPLRHHTQLIFSNQEAKVTLYLVLNALKG